MSDFITRLETEEQELNERLEKLETFLASEKGKSIGKIDALLLAKQYEVMTYYSRILNARIIRLTRG